MNGKLFLLMLLFLVTTFISNSEMVWADKLLGFSSQKSPREYGAIQVLGKPNILPNFGESPTAWMPQLPSKRIEWIKVGFTKPIFVEEILLNENCITGAVVSITAYDSLSQGINIYSNNDIGKFDNKGKITKIPINRTSFRVEALKIEVYLNDVFEPYQIESISVSDKPTDFEIVINSLSDSEIYNMPENLSSNINSQYSELAPIISADGQKLFFTRDYHPENIGEQKKQDIWYSELDENGNFKLAQNLGAPLNDETSNYSISTSNDGNMLIVGNVYNKDGTKSIGFSISEFEEGKWTYPEPITIEDYYNLSPTGSYNLSSNQKVLLMAIERYDSQGETDIYVSFRLDENYWSAPKSIGKTINTAASEDSPFLASDGKTLYFSSSGFPGYGSNDMFMTKRLDDTWTNWSEPQNLGPGINTPGWDAYYTITADGQFAYFVTNKGGVGQNDIYRVRLGEEIQPESVAIITGKVLNSKTNEPLKADIIYEVLPEGTEAGIAKSNPNTGEYTIILPSGKKYGFLASAEGFISQNENLDLRIESEFVEIEKDLLLVPIEKGQTVRINNIFFEFGKYELLEDSFSELKRIVKFMNQNPDIKIQINGHTDNIGSDADNQILSENRAKAVAKYLIEKGVAETRILTKGFGKSKSIANNTTEEGRKKNRRVEFIIIEK